MTVTIQDESTNGYPLVYNETFWTGKRTLCYNGTPLRRQSKKQFFLDGDDGTAEFGVEGNRFTGIRVVSPLFAQPLQITRKLAVWEYILAVLVFIPGILFGAIGGAIGGVLGYVNLELMLRIKRVWLRVVVAMEMTFLCAIIAFGIALLMMTLIGSTIGWGIV